MGWIQSFVSQRRIDDAPPPYLLHLRSSKAFIVSTVCLAVFTDIFLYGIIVPVQPFTLSSRAGVPQSDVQRWVSILLAVYGAALLVSSPVTGWYADRSSSRRFPLLFGLVALGASTVLLCLARSVELLVVGRLLQGFSAAIVWTVGSALLVDTVGQGDIGQMMGWVSLSMSIGFLLAPLLGGIVYEKAGYYPVFYMAFASVAFDIILRLALIEKKIALQWKTNGSLDIEQTTDSEEARETPPSTCNEKTAGAAAQAAPGATPETTAPTKLSKWPPIFTLLASRRLLAASWGVIAQGSLLTAFDSTVPLFVQRTFHWNTTGAGLIFLALIVPSFVAPAVGWASDHYGPRWISVSGFLLAIPFWILLRLVTHDSLNQKVLFSVLLVLIGTALTLAMTPLMAEITYIVEAKEKESPGRFGPNGAYAQAYGLFITAFAAGTMIGPLWGGYVEDAAGWGTMTWSLSLFSLAAAIPCLIFTGGLITKVNAKTAEERAVGPASVAR